MKQRFRETLTHRVVETLCVELGCKVIRFRVAYFPSRKLDLATRYNVFDLT